MEEYKMNKKPTHIFKVFKSLKGKTTNQHMIIKANALRELDEFRRFLAENDIDNSEIWKRLNRIEKSILGK